MQALFLSFFRGLSLFIMEFSPIKSPIEEDELKYLFKFYISAFDKLLLRFLKMSSYSLIIFNSFSSILYSKFSIKKSGLLYNLFNKIYPAELSLSQK